MKNIFKKLYRLDEKDVRTIFVLLQEMLAQETIRRALIKNNGNYQDTLR